MKKDSAGFGDSVSFILRIPEGEKIVIIGFAAEEEEETAAETEVLPTK